MEELLKWMREEKFFLDKDGKWYSTNIKGRLSPKGLEKPKTYNEEQLCELFINNKHCSSR